MEEKLDFLIKFLTKDIGENINELPVTLEEKEKMWRALCNIRHPKEISNEYLNVQDEFLQERLKTLEITDSKKIKTLDKMYPNVDIKNGILQYYRSVDYRSNKYNI